MTLMMQQKKEAMMARCHLQLERQRYKVAEKIITFKQDY